MAKIIYQYMIEPKIYAWLEQKNRQARHKTLSQTINWILKQNVMIEKYAEEQDKQVQKKEIKKKSIFDEMEEKYNLKRFKND